MIVAFFDFDGTITTKDSFLEFIVFTKGRTNLLKGILANLPSVLGYKLGFVSGHSVKEKLITHFYKGQSIDTFSKNGKQYALKKMNTIIRHKAVERIKWHQEQGHEVVVVSASLKQWIEPWCETLNIKCITTEMEVVNKSITGKLKGKNCIGAEKVNQIKKAYSDVTLKYTYAYGNSKGDKELLAFADESFYRHF